MPQSIFKAVADTFNDGATLKKPESAHIPIAPAAPGLFSLPTLILATYRSVGPYYYSTQPYGNMYLYNDTIWLSTNLQKFITEWESRQDIPSNTYNMSKLVSDVKVLESFGKRAYTNELNSQRTVINDLLGGAYNFFQQDGQGQDELEAGLKIVIRHIRDTAAAWEKVLAYSAWASATGSLVNAVATKLVADVFDLTDIGVDEAERTATLLARVEELDDLFVPKREKGQMNGAGDDVPMTAQFADKWMKMKFLSEVLQSNLKDVKFLWFDSDLSLYFTVDEVVDLINLSFEKNTAVKQAIREIRENPEPRQEER
jgi:centromere/kinetochore protein ZW10